MSSMRQTAEETVGYFKEFFASVLFSIVRKDEEALSEWEYFCEMVVPKTSSDRDRLETYLQILAHNRRGGQLGEDPEEDVDTDYEEEEESDEEKEDDYSEEREIEVEEGGYDKEEGVMIVGQRKFFEGSEEDVDLDEEKELKCNNHNHHHYNNNNNINDNSNNNNNIYNHQHKQRIQLNPLPQQQLQISPNTSCTQVLHQDSSLPHPLEDILREVTPLYRHQQSSLAASHSLQQQQGKHTELLSVISSSLTPMMPSTLQKINTSYVGGFKVSENKSGQQFNVNNMSKAYIEKENLNDPTAESIDKSSQRNYVDVHLRAAAQPIKQTPVFIEAHMKGMKKNSSEPKIVEVQVIVDQVQTSKVSDSRLTKNQVCNTGSTFMNEPRLNTTQTRTINQTINSQEQAQQKNGLNERQKQVQTRQLEATVAFKERCLGGPTYDLLIRSENEGMSQTRTAAATITSSVGSNTFRFKTERLRSKIAKVLSFCEGNELRLEFLSNKSHESENARLRIDPVVSSSQLSPSPTIVRSVSAMSSHSQQPPSHHQQQQVQYSNINKLHFNYSSTGLFAPQTQPIFTPPQTPNSKQQAAAAAAKINHKPGTVAFSQSYQRNPSPLARTYITVPHTSNIHSRSFHNPPLSPQMQQNSTFQRQNTYTIPSVSLSQNSASPSLFTTPVSAVHALHIPIASKRMTTYEGCGSSSFSLFNETRPNSGENRSASVYSGSRTLAKGGGNITPSNNGNCSSININNNKGYLVQTMEDKSFSRFSQDMKKVEVNRNRVECNSRSPVQRSNNSCSRERIQSSKERIDYSFPDLKTFNKFIRKN